MNSWSPELRAELRDFKKFLRLLQVFDKNAGKTVPFVPTAPQLALVECLMTSNRVVILKARQIGASTIVRAWFTWKALLADQPVKCGIMSYTHESASYLHGLDKGFVSCLPAALSRKTDRDTARTIKFKDTGAELRSFTSGMKGGGTRSFALTDLHLSEFAHFDDQDEILANAVSSVGEGGQIVIETTANGPGNKYHDLVTHAAERGWTLFWSPWFDHPAYTKEARFGFQRVPPKTQTEKVFQRKWGLTDGQMYWRRTMISSMGEDKFKQEYPSTPEEAFTTSQRLWLLPSHLEGLDVRKGGGKEMCLVDPETMGEEPLVLGVDVAAGTGGDFTAVTAVSVDTGQPIWHWHCNDESPGRFTERLLKWIEKWDIRCVLVESNAHGGIVLQRLRDLGVDQNILWRDDSGKDWNTNKWTKLRALEELKTRLEDSAISVMSEPLYRELQQLDASGHTPRAPKGCYDDLVMATALAYVALLDVPSMSLRETREKLMDTWIKTQRVSKILSGDRLPWRRRQYA